MTKNDLKITSNDPHMTFRQKKMHHCVRQGKNTKSCRDFYPLTLIILDLFMKKGKNIQK